jgi:hypothetical protein
MRPLSAILSELRARSDCTFQSATRLPDLPNGLTLPEDLKAFYQEFSEARLFGDPSDPEYTISKPEEFVQIGVAIMDELSSNPVQHSWYALAHVQDGNYIAIDCHPDRLGYCYDAFHETIDDLSYCTVIARSFTELMNAAISAGDSTWWLEEDFEGYGTAEEFSESEER